MAAAVETKKVIVEDWSELGLEGLPSEPSRPPQEISLTLVMRGSLSKEDFERFEQAPPEEAMEQAQMLKTIHLEWQDIGEIANLDMFDACEVLYMQHNIISRIEGLEALCNLQFLALQHNRIQRVENLMQLEHLEFLDLRDNLIDELDVEELPQNINILNMKGNACATIKGYREKVLERLPHLAYLDGSALQDPEEAEREAEEMKLDALRAELTTSLPEAGPGDTGLSAYYRKSALQQGLASSIHDQIEAYSLEATGDGDVFGNKVEHALARSLARRQALAQSSSTSSTTRRLSASLSKPLDVPPE
mmetsp:Transcript_65770/g.157176  ORF Transcript_65770/g.157176 Transcript_65770/m.157176 type:complete len:306 (+) Transcript_65770:31-948(+)